MNPDSPGDVVALDTAREELIRAVLRRVTDERDEPHAHFDAQLEYDDERIDDAVRRYYGLRLAVAEKRSES